MRSQRALAKVVCSGLFCSPLLARRSNGKRNKEGERRSYLKIVDVDVKSSSIVVSNGVHESLVGLAQDTGLLVD